MTTLWAPAKLTLSLKVVGSRADGHHLIDAEMVTLDLADRLEVSDGDGLVVDSTGLDVDDGASSGDDLVSRSLRLVGRTAAVTLRKAIPAGAGLGGGSADAGALLRWGGYTDVVGAASIGADVPFCLVGGRARVGGIGEEVQALAFRERTFTLLTPPFGCSTPAVYGAWDRLGGPTGGGGNDLEPAALVLEPRLAVYRDRLEHATGREPRLAGSGSTWFVEGSYPGEDRVVVMTTPAGWAGP